MLPQPSGGGRFPYNPMRLERRIVVLNFGANVVVDAALRSAAVERVRDALSRGQAPIVVCSPAATPAGGEIHWTGRFVDAVAAGNIRAVALTRQQIGIQPVGGATVEAMLILELLDQGVVPVVTGAMPHGAGSRGGSDLAAVQLADALAASAVIVYTTTDGVMSGDPQRIATATPVTFVSYLELMELAGDASLVSPGAAEHARARNVRYEVRGITTDRGSAVRDDVLSERTKAATAVAVAADVALVTVRLPKGGAVAWERARGDMLERLARRDVAIEMFQFFPGGVRFVCERARLPAVRELVAAAGLRARATERCSRIVLVGASLRSTAGVFSRLLRALAVAHIEVLHVADSNVTISIIVAESDAEPAERIVHDEIVARPASRSEQTLRFEAATGRAQVRGRTVQLGERQAALLAYFVEHGGRVIPIEELADAVFGSEERDAVDAVRVHIHNLRKKIEDDPKAPQHLVTVPNQGYRFSR